MTLELYPLPALVRVCGWCGSFLGLKPCEPAMDGQATHTLCPECLRKQLEQLKEVESNER